MPRLADTTPTIYEQHLNESSHGFVRVACQRGTQGTFGCSMFKRACEDPSPFSYLSAVSVSGSYPLPLYELDSFPQCYAYRSRVYNP